MHRLFRPVELSDLAGQFAQRSGVVLKCHDDETAVVLRQNGEFDREALNMLVLAIVDGDIKPVELLLQEQSQGRRSFSALPRDAAVRLRDVLALFAVHRSNSSTGCAAAAARFASPASAAASAMHRSNS